ncbi:MAG: sigma-E factor negative regulatory protein [Luteimonas sp.]
MIGTDKIATDKIATDKLGADKFEQHYRQQLSALMDGALSPDEARFLVRRLQHDVELAQCLDRWHMAGDALRGEAQAILPAGFAERVAAAIAVEPASVPAGVSSRLNRGGLRWAGGAALAASVALVALFVTRQPAGSDAVETSSSVAARVSSATAPAAAATEAPAVPVSATPLASAATQSVATASLPQRDTLRRSTRSQSQRVTSRTSARSERPMVATATPQGDVSGNDVFVGTAANASRPWPGAVLRHASSADFMVGYGRIDDGSASSPSFYPFEPLLPGAQREGTEPESVNDAVAPPP